MGQFNLGEILGIVGLVVALILYVLAPTPLIKGLLLCFALALVVYLIVGLVPALNQLKLIPKLLIGVGAWSLICGIAYTPVAELLNPTVPVVAETAPTEQEVPSGPKLTASFTEMVQLIPLGKNENFHGVVRPIDSPTTMIFAQVVVRNEGLPSIADDWSMWLTVGGEDVKADTVPVPDFTYRLNAQSPAIEFHQSEAIYNVSVSAPITREVPIRGFFIGRFALDEKTVTANLASLRLRFHDGNGAQYESVPKKVGKFRPDFEVVPGLGKIVP